MAQAGPDRAGLDFVSQLHDSEWKLLESLGTRRRYRAGSTLFHEGDDADRVMILLNGRAVATSYTWDGQEIMLEVLHPGHAVGAVSAIDGGAHSATVIALGDVEALIINPIAFRDFVCSAPSIALAFMRTLSSLFRTANRKRVALGTSDVTSRVAGVLLDLAEQLRTSPDDTTSVRLSQQELARWVSASREAAGKALQDLRRQGLVEYTRGLVTIVDPGGLAARAR